MTRDELISATRQLIDEGARLQASPSLPSLQVWLQRSDDLLATAWGSMDRYHLAWLLVGKPKSIVRGRPMTRDEEAAYVREVAQQKTAALQMSLNAVERHGMPFVGESGGPALARPRTTRGIARLTARRTGPGCPRTPAWPNAWQRPVAAPRRIWITTHPGRHDRTGCSDDAGRGRDPDCARTGSDRP